MRRTNFSGILRYKQIPNLGQTKPNDSQQQKGNLPNRGFCCPGRQLIKSKGSEKRDKYLDHLEY